MVSSLARKHRLPPRSQAFIREHHGTMLTRYQYARALEAVAMIPNWLINLFSAIRALARRRETALLMLADGVEARARAELPKNEEEIRVLIKKVFDYVQKEEQLEDTTLTFRDLYAARSVFENAVEQLPSPHPVSRN